MCWVISSQFLLANPAPNLNLVRRTRKSHRRRKPGAVRVPISASNLDDKSTTLVTFLGKGGSGKTTSAVLAAQHYAMSGLSTCLVFHAQDPTPDFLLNCKIGTSPILCNNNLSAVRLETTKMLLEPLNRLKQADAQS
ncbi:hypothetical protein Dsin_009649 [Dipteronia sinensis]|uniref:ArsA/GET3 Anion-transporting ATPase-like domain-containing protein n=1 Tax=Dipteronia sinensis TaxID=43782 RepID=A0AAE0EC47_9ROSI|nr:hypothetical protein Dsin_009649 [Dipteronia sinensis]